MTDREIMQQALDALEIAEVDGNCYYEATELLRKRLAQPEQQPVAWMHTMIGDVVISHRPADLNRHPERWKPLYTTPPAAPEHMENT
jgi:hypothetical protein